MVAAADEGGAVGCGQEGLDFGPVEEGDQRAVEALVGDGEDALDEGGVLGVTEGGEVEEGVDGGEAGVAGAGRVAANSLQVGQEVAGVRSR